MRSPKACQLLPPCHKASGLGNMTSTAQMLLMKTMMMLMEPRCQGVKSSGGCLRLKPRNECCFCCRRDWIIFLDVHSRFGFLKKWLVLGFWHPGNKWLVDSIAVSLFVNWLNLSNQKQIQITSWWWEGLPTPAWVSSQIQDSTKRLSWSRPQIWQCLWFYHKIKTFRGSLSVKVFCLLCKDLIKL